MKTVMMGTVNLSTGMPKIGVTLSGADRQTLLGQAAQILTSAAQIVSWRLDTYQELDNLAELINTATQLQQVLGDIPIIANFQLFQHAVPAADYYQTYLALVNNRAVTAIDVDLKMINQIDYMTLTKQARTNGIQLVLSQTLDPCPASSELVASYQAMAAAGADVARMTVTGTSAATVLLLMSATAAARQQLTIPIVATVTGTLGRFNSVCGQLTGSAIAFGRVGRVGNQEQLPVSQLKQALQTLATVEGA